MEFNLELAVVTKQLQVKLKESGSTGDQPQKKALKDKALILQSLRKMVSQVSLFLFLSLSLTLPNYM